MTFEESTKVFFDGYKIVCDLVDKYPETTVVNLSLREVQLDGELNVTMSISQAVELLRNIYTSITGLCKSSVMDFDGISILTRRVTYFQVILPDGATYTYVPYGVTINE